MKIGESISRIRNSVKAVREDAFMTDRFIYSLVLKWTKLLIRRSESMNKLLKFNHLFKTLPCYELIDVDRVEAGCNGIVSGITIKRTKEKIPNPLEATFGPLIRAVTSIDGSKEIYRTYPTLYTSMTKTSGFKYNKKKYYWYINEHLYFPNIEWDAVLIEGIFDEDISLYSATEDACVNRKDQDFPAPEYLFAEIEKYVIQDILTAAQLPQDPAIDDKQHLLRS